MTGATAPTSDILTPGDTFGDYEVLSVLSRGPDGCVAAAHHPATQEDVVIKIRDHGAEAVEREAAALQQIEHPNVVRLVAMEPAADPAHLVVSLVPGRPLSQWLKENPEPDETAVRTILQGIADGLDAIHAAGLVHRDIKPGNVIVGPENQSTIIDLSAAASAGEAKSDSPSELTPGYAAPEQYEVQGREGPWTDVYGLGALAYRLVTGTVPPDTHGATAAPSAQAIAAGRYSPGLLDTIDAALQLDEFARPPSGAAFMEAIRAGAPSPTHAVDPDDAPTIRVQRLPDIRPRPPAVSPAMPTADRGGMPRWLRRTGQALALLVVLVGVFWTLERPANGPKLAWVVDPAGLGDAVTISEALAAAPPGATISVMPGDYAETLVVAHAVSIIAANDDAKVRILPETGPCLLGTASHGLVKGLHFEATATNPSRACIILSGSGIAIEGNSFAGRSGPAITISGSSEPLIRNNRLDRIDGPGIVIEAGAGGLIVANEIARTTAPAVIVTDGSRPTIAANTISESAQAGILYENGAAGLAFDNEILGNNASGIELRAAARPTVRGNRIQAGRQAGLYAYAGASGLIVDNAITDNSFSGVVLEDAAAKLVDNEIRDNAEHGVLVLKASGGTITGNTVVGNAGHGLAVTLDAVTTIENNDLSGNQEPQTQRGTLADPE